MALWVRSVSSSCVPLRIAAVMAISVATDQIAPAAVLKVSLVALVSWSCVLKLGTAADMAAHRARCKKDAPAPVMQASMDPNVNSNTVTLRTAMIMENHREPVRLVPVPVRLDGSVNSVVLYHPQPPLLFQPLFLLLQHPSQHLSHLFHFRGRRWKIQIRWPWTTAKLLWNSPTSAFK